MAVFFNWHRPHGSVNAKSPIDIITKLGEKTPYWDDIYDNYDASKERIREQNYQDDLKIQKLLNQIEKKDDDI